MHLSRRSLIGATVISLFLSLPTFAISSEHGPTAIVGAMPEEVGMFREQMAGLKLVKVTGLTFWTGKIKGHRVVLTRCGIGKVNAAMTTTVLIEQFHPSALVFSGIAGGINDKLGPGDIVIGDKTVQHDFGFLSPEGLKPGPTENPSTGKNNPLYFAADPALLKAAKAAVQDVHLQKVQTGRGIRTPRITHGVIVTGDQFIASSTKKNDLRSTFNADATEMEGASIAQVCLIQRVPCLIIRSLSDNADESAQTDLAKLFHVAAINSSHLVIAMLNRMKGM